MNMQKRNNNNGGGKMRHGGRRFSNHRNNNGGGNRGGQNDGQNMARQKHHAMQMREKYSNMAKDAQMNGDVVDMEYYLQHVDHYVRVLTEIGAIEAERFAERAQHQQQHHAEQDTSAEAVASEDTQGDAGAAPAEAAEQPQPRPQRRSYGSTRPRQHVSSEPMEPNPNANTVEIPLPDSVIPQI